MFDFRNELNSKTRTLIDGGRLKQADADFAYTSSHCDLCLAKLKEGDPDCVKGCEEGAIKYIEIEANPREDRYSIGDDIVVHTRIWDKEREGRVRK